MNQININKFDIKIIGGREVNPRFKYPLIVALYANDKHFFCGGTLYKNNKTITAAHCDHGSNHTHPIKLHRYDFTKIDSEENGKTYKVIDRKSHKNYNKTNENYIAIWIIDAKVKSNKFLIEFDNCEYVTRTIYNVRVIVWGKEDENDEETSEILKEVDLPIYDIDECKKILNNKTEPAIYSKTNIYAVHDKGYKDAFQGDSGGPLVVINESKLTLFCVTS